MAALLRVEVAVDERDLERVDDEGLADLSRARRAGVAVAVAAAIACQMGTGVRRRSGLALLREVFAQVPTNPTASGTERALELRLASDPSVAAAVLGGLESIPGAIIGGFLVGIIEMLVGGLVSTAFQDVSAFFIIMLVLFLKPDGLFGVRAMSRV